MVVDGRTTAAEATEEPEEVTMSSPLGVDPNVLREQAAKMQEFADQRAEHVANVVRISSTFTGAWTGQAGTAVQKALESYVQEASDTRREEMEIADALLQAAAQYDQTDAGAAGGLSRQMGI
jgi:WXG100 family type VII secretion target